MTVNWANESWALLPELAIYWARSRTVIIADPHFGKDASFRSMGTPIPEGTTKRDLERLEGILSVKAVERLIVLGDFFHSRSSRQPATMELLSNWRDKHSGLQLVNIPGNHDRHAGNPPDSWNIQVEYEPWLSDGLTFRHHPLDEAKTPTLAGHLHPSVTLREKAGTTMSLSCFWLFGEQLVVPAFGGFTGKAAVKSKPGDRMFVVADQVVIELSVKRR
jgi:uncharacterized protein